jgi:hypothetical protein
VKDGKRHSKFHSGDHSISVDDLWKAWQESEGTCNCSLIYNLIRIKQFSPITVACVPVHC